MVDSKVRAESRLAPSHPRPSRSALIDLTFVTAFVWISVFVIHHFHVPEALADWGALNEQWAIDEVTMVSLCVAAGLGVFSWRRWQESLKTISRHEATLERLRTTEIEVRSKDRLIRSVSHELRTPLTALLGYAELLGTEELSEAEQVDILATIVDQGRDLAHIVDDLLTRAQADADTLKVARVSLSLGAQAAQVLEGWNPDQISRITSSADRDHRAFGDPSRVRQIIRNLLSNAIRYGDGAIDITTATSQTAGWIKVANDGDPVPKDERDRIFLPYHRIAGSGPQPGGLGLGLSISRQLAMLMGGDVTYDYVGERSVFTLTLSREEARPDKVPTIVAADPFSVAA